MKFVHPLIPGRLIKRYKRFLADVELDDGTLITAHCANPGSMLGLAKPGFKVWLSQSDNPKRKLKYSWELVEAGDTGTPSLVGINTGHPNKLVREAIEQGVIGPLDGYTSLRPEQKYGTNSRIDILLEARDRPPCYVEIKNVHLMRRAGLAEFPDSVTARGAKHLDELSAQVRAGARSVMIYLIQRMDAANFALAGDIDPTYVTRFKAAYAAGVEALAYDCTLTPEEIAVRRAIPIRLPD
jgi:sugar fermentation stimulation protein A